MTPHAYGVLSGAVLGAVAVGPMFKMSFPDKRAGGLLIALAFPYAVR